MNQRFKSLARALIPPFLWHLATRASRGSSHEWEWWPQGFATLPAGQGWSQNEVAQQYEAGQRRFEQELNRTEPLGIEHQNDEVGFHQLFLHNLWMTFGVVLSRAAQDRQQLSVLDWGGGVGNMALLAQALRPDIQLNYSCKEVETVARAGSRIHPEWTFYFDDLCFERTYDLVMAITSIHYNENWKEVFEKLVRSSTNWLFIGRLPMCFDSPSYVFVQRAASYGFNTQYIGWCLNRAEFLEQVQQQGWQIEREFLVGEAPPIHQAPSRCQYRSFLLRPVPES